jgi:hypothetical protein
MPSTDFSIFNPTAANQEDDSSYQGDSQRSGGASDGEFFDATLANKFFYQVSLAVRALMLKLVNDGYSPVDGTSPYQADTSTNTAATALAAVFSNIVTAATFNSYLYPFRYDGLGWSTNTGGEEAFTISIPLSILKEGSVIQLSVGYSAGSGAGFLCGNEPSEWIFYGPGYPSGTFPQQWTHVYTGVVSTVVGGNVTITFTGVSSVLPSGAASGLSWAQNTTLTLGSSGSNMVIIGYQSGSGTLSNNTMFSAVVFP